MVPSFSIIVGSDCWFWRPNFWKVHWIFDPVIFYLLHFLFSRHSSSRAKALLAKKTFSILSCGSRWKHTSGTKLVVFVRSFLFRQFRFFEMFVEVLVQVECASRVGTFTKVVFHNTFMVRNVIVALSRRLENHSRFLQ